MDNLHIKIYIQDIRKVSNQRYGQYNPTSYLKTCGHILFEMLGSNFGPDGRYLRSMDSNVNKTRKRGK